MPVVRLCKVCGKKITVYSTLQNKCFDCTKKNTKSIPQRGKEYRLWVTFRDKVAKPYLDKRFGHVCNVKRCSETENLDVDHKKTRGAHPGLKFDVKNLQYLCRSHHINKTNGKELKYKHG